MKEIRNINVEFKAEPEEDGKLKIKGYAAVFDSPENYGYTEVIAPTAFDEADLSDVVLRYNHSEDFLILARVRNKSLKLEVDKDNKYGNRGLYMEAELQNDITIHKDVYNAVKSGLIDKESFAFYVLEDEYDYDTDTRTITKIGKVFDTSLVDQPFYNDTNVEVDRSINNNSFMEKRAELRKQHEEQLALEKKKKELEDAKNKLMAKLG